LKKEVMTRKKRKQKPQIITYIIILLLGFVFVYPMWHTFVVSFGDRAYALSDGFKFWPPNPTLDAYKEVFSGKRIYYGYMNTLFRAFFGTTLTLVVTFCGAYAMRYKDMPGYAFISFLIIFVMYFGGGAVPGYINIKNLGLLNNRWVYVLPGIAGTYNLLVMRSFINSLGRELEEAARIDGANPMQTMIKIYVPLSKAIMAVIGLWCVVGHWNAYYDGMVYCTRQELIVLQNAIRAIIGQADQNENIGNLSTLADVTSESVRCATIMIATAPILAGYPFIQKYLVKGTMIGALKG